MAEPKLMKKIIEKKEKESHLILLRQKHHTLRTVTIAGTTLMIAENMYAATCRG